MTSFEDNVQKAKVLVIRNYEGRDTTERKWLEADLDSYKSEDYRVTLYVLEGSPPKGIVLANRGRGVVFAISAQNTLLKTFNTGATGG